MSTAPKIPPITVEQYLAFQDPPGYRSELLHGEIILSPDPKPLHHDVVENIFELLKQHVGTRFKVCTRINVDFSAEFYMPSPDVFVIEREAWRYSRNRNAYPSGNVILAVEVISPSNTEENVADKTQLYLRNGAAQVWNVYPSEKYCLLYSPEGGSVRLENGPIILPAPLPNISIDLGDFFRLD